MEGLVWLWMGGMAMSWLAVAICGAATLWHFKHWVIGFLLGLLLGPFGLYIAIMIRSTANIRQQDRQHDQLLAAIVALSAPPKSLRDCPFCDESIKPKAKVCKHCAKVVVKKAENGQLVYLGLKPIVEDSPLAQGAFSSTDN